MENRPVSDETDITILEYLKSLLTPGKQHAQSDSRWTPTDTGLEQQQDEPAEELSGRGRFPWFCGGTAVLALFAQICASNRMAFFSLVLYAGAGFCLFLAWRRQEWSLPLQNELHGKWQFFTGRTWLLIPGLVLASAAFLLFGTQRFGLASTFCWITAIILTTFALWNKSPKDRPERVSVSARIQTLLIEDRLWFIAMLVVVAVVGWFSFARLQEVPPELVSGQVDHVFTVRDILAGNPALTFSRNLVSEPLQYLWGALISLATGSRAGFVGLKLAYALANLAALYFIYRLAADIFDRWVGLAAVFLLGVSFWQIIQTRALLGSGLVLPLGCAALYFLFSGFSTHKSNNLLLSALFVGLGLLTNKVFLIFPLASLVCAILWLTIKREQGGGRLLLVAFAQSLLVGAVVSVPLLRAAANEPTAYFAPILSRVSDYETALSAHPLTLFFTNLWSALGIANWSNRSSWVDGLTLKPGLDLLSAAFFVLGVGAVLLKLRNNKDWRAAALLALYPLLLLPSVLSLAFPLENPSLSRGLGALIPVCVLSAVGLRALMGAVFAWSPARGKSYRFVVTGLVFLAIISLNYQAAFRDYPANYRQSAWNSFEMANIIRQTELSTGFPQNAWVVGYPYWVDARAVALEADRPDQDLALASDQLEQTVNVLGSKLFLIHPLDGAAVEKLQQLYPTGTFAMYASSIPEKDFLVFLVKP